MKLNYIPGLALRFFPGNTRELYDGVNNYDATDSKVVIMTGAAPSETELWNLTDLEAFVTANESKVVYRENCTFSFSYNGFKHQRVIQRMPIDSTPFTPLVSTLVQPTYTQEEIEAGAIKTDNSLYALIYFKDKDTTLNTIGNDMIMLVPNVGTQPDDFVSLSKVNFSAGDSLYLRNITISLFQGYQITDTVIMGDIPDPENPGEIITGPIATKKSFYYNKVWGNRISEAYRDCFISRSTFNYKTGTTVSNNLVTSPYSYVQDYISGPATNAFALREYDKVNNVWKNTFLNLAITSSMIYNGFLGNESLINLLDEINSKSMLNQFGSLDSLVHFGSEVPLVLSNTQRFVYSNNATTHKNAESFTQLSEQKMNLIPGLIAKYLLLVPLLTADHKTSLIQLLIELGFDESMVNAAIKSIVPIGFDLTKYSSSFDKDTGILTIQNSTPAKLVTRYKKTIHNPTNEQLYIVLPRYLNRMAIENSYDSYQSSSVGYCGSISSVSFPSTQTVIDGEAIDVTTQRIRLQDYTAISIGLTGNGNTDLEYDYLAMIDYIDSFTAMIKIPNKF